MGVGVSGQLHATSALILEGIHLIGGWVGSLSEVLDAM
jgi:hypothetical protein